MDGFSLESSMLSLCIIVPLPSGLQQDGRLQYQEGENGAGGQPDSGKKIRNCISPALVDTSGYIGHLHLTVCAAFN